MPQLIEGKNTTADDNTNWPRKNFIYATDGGKVAAIRMGDWKLLFLEQKCKGWEVWACPLVSLPASAAKRERRFSYPGWTTCCRGRNC